MSKKNFIFQESGEHELYWEQWFILIFKKKKKKNNN